MRLGSIGCDDLFRPPFFPIGDQHDAPESGLREVVESGLVKGVGQAQVRILSRQLGPEHPREELAAAQAGISMSLANCYGNRSYRQSRRIRLV